MALRVLESEWSQWAFSGRCTGVWGPLPGLLAVSSKQSSICSFCLPVPPCLGQPRGTHTQSLSISFLEVVVCWVSLSSYHDLSAGMEKNGWGVVGGELSRPHNFL